MAQVVPDDDLPTFRVVPQDDLPGAAPKPSQKRGLIEDVKDVGTAFAEGVPSLLRRLKATGQAVTGDLPGVEATARSEQQAASKSEAGALSEFKQDLARRKAASDGSWSQAASDLGGAIAQNPAAVPQLVAESVPNAAVSIGGALAGAKAGAVAAPFLGPLAPLAPIAGGLLGYFLGNTAVETGGKAIEKAGDGFTREERGEALREGAVKGAVLTGVDALTFGATKLLYTPVGKAMEKAGAEALVSKGVDITSREAVEAALKDKAIRGTVEAAQTAALKTANTGGRGMARGAGAFGLQTVSEGAGEGLGEYAATGEVDPTNILLESIAGAGQSAIEIGVAKTGRGARGLIDAARGVEPGASPDAQLDRSLDQLQRARDEVYLGTSEGKETLASIVSAPDLGAAIDAAEANVPSMADLLQQKRTTAAERVAQELGIEPAGNFPTAEQIIGGAPIPGIDVGPTGENTRPSVFGQSAGTPGLQPGETRILTQPSVFAEPSAGTPGLQPGQTRILTQPSVFADSDSTPGLQPGQRMDTPTPPTAARLNTAQTAVDRDAQLLAQRDGTPAPQPPAKMLQDAQRLEESARLIESNPRAPEAVLQRAQALREQAQAMRARAEEMSASAPAAQPGAMTEFERGSIDAQRQTNLEKRMPARAEGEASSYADLAPMDERTARGRLKVLRDQAANEGGDALGLQVVPHPNTPGRFAIAKAELPSLDMPAAAAPAPVTQQEAGQRLETAAAKAPGDAEAMIEALKVRDTGQVVGAQLLDMLSPGDRAAYSDVLRSVEARDGKATPLEAALLDRVNPGGQNYDSVVSAPLGGEQLRTLRSLTQNINSLGDGQQQAKDAAGQQLRLNALVRQGERAQGIEQPRAGRPLETVAVETESPTAGGVARAGKLDRRTGEQRSDDAVAAMQKNTLLKQISQSLANLFPQQKTTEAPDVGLIDRVLRKTGALRTADEKLVVDGARKILTPAQFDILQRAALNPASLGAVERLQLRRMREGDFKFSEQREETNVAPEATQQGRPVSNLGNITTVDPTTLQTQSKADSGTISKQTHRMVSLIASMFGKKVVVFSSDNETAPDGFVRTGDSKTIHLNVKSQISHLVVFGHELLHQLKADNPQAYAALMKIIKLNADANLNVPGIRGDMEELTADVVGNRFRETEFWRDVFREILASGTDTKASQRSAMRLGASVVRAVDRMVKALKGMTGFDTDSMVANLGEVKAAVTKALASYAQEKRGEATELIRQEAAGRQEAAVETTGEIKASDQRGRLDNLEAYHYSQSPRSTLSSSMFGTGLRGSAREEYLNADDQRRRQRISFYFDKGTGVRPESGVGGVPHRATLNNIYDSNADPLGLRKGGQAAFESKVLDAGFDGYLDRMEGTQPGQIIMLGQRTVPVQALPPGPIRAGSRVEPLQSKPAGWATQSSGPNRAALEQKMERMQSQESWANYDMQVVDAGSGFFSLQTKLKDDVRASAKRVPGSPEFKKWFGDSKVVDGRGRPLVVYHGTYTDFSKFRGGGYFSADPGYSSTTARVNAEAYEGAAQVMPVYLSVQNPAIRDVDFVEGIGYSESAIADLEEQGYDGVMTPDKSEIYVFRPEQIKSAIGNQGTYDPGNPDIRKSEKRILLNIGLSTQEVKGGGMLTEDVVRSAITRTGVEVEDLTVHQSDSELTAVVAVNRGLTDAEGDDLSARLNQEAIVQRMPDGSGKLFGPMAAEWGPYNAEYFVMADGNRAVDYEPIKESAKRRKTQEAGVEVPTSVDRAADSTAAFKRARGKVFETNRELKTEIQDAVRAAAEDAGVDLPTFSEETEKYLVRVATAEAVKALRENANAIGWYREKVTKALRIAALKHPELNTNPESRMVFIWALAVTSNGMRVKKNFELADKAYSSWKRYGKFPTNIGPGAAKKAINNGLRAYNVLSKKMTFDQLHDAMLTKSSVAQIGKLLGIKPSGEYTDTIVYGSAILGPKVGNGFFANLYGHYEQLTIDRWLMRTWGRWTGTLVEVKTDVVAKKADRLSALLEMLTDEQRTQLEQAIGRTVYLDDLEPTAAAISAATVKESVRDALDEVGPLDNATRARLVEILGKEKANSKRVSLGDEIRKAGIGLNMAIDGQVEAPRDPQQRNDMRKVFEQVLAELQKTNPGLTMSDLQAVLWYPEKRIYDAAKTDEETNDGYEDGAAPDYANAAAEHYRGRGVAKSAIDRVVAEVDSELQTADGAGRGGRSTGGVAQQPGSAGVSDPSVRASEKRTPLGFYSALADGIDGIKTNAAPAQGWKDAVKGLVNKGTVKADEVEWSGVNDWLDLQRGKVSKEQVAQYLEQGGVRVEETALGGYDRGWRLTPDDGGPGMVYGEGDLGELEADKAEFGGTVTEIRIPKDGDTKYSQYTLPGGTNYREVLLTLPPKRRIEQTKRTQYQLFEDGEMVSVGDERSAARWRERNPNADVRTARVLDQRTRLEEESAGLYRSTHWDQPNVLAHIRVNDRPDADGNKVLFVEEIQSDWGQEGKKKGFIGGKVKGYQVQFNGRPVMTYETRQEADAHVERAKGFDKEAPVSVVEVETTRHSVNERAEGKVLNAPFVTKTEGWLNLALKRIMVMAAEGGYDKVAFVNGAQSAERYDLSKQVERVTAYKETGGAYRISATDINGKTLPAQRAKDAAELEGIVGKELAQKIVDQKSLIESYSGLDLKVGGEGMRAFYDLIVPQVAKDVLKRLGGDGLTTVQIGLPSTVTKYQVLDERNQPDGEPFDTEREADEYIDDSDYTIREVNVPAGDATAQAQPGFDVTDAMREKVAEGLPLFSEKRNIFGQKVLSNWTAPTDSKLAMGYTKDSVIYKLQDKMVDTKRVVDTIKSALGALADKWNPYLQEELYHGRTAKQTKDFLEDELKPLLQSMNLNKVSIADFEEYLHNRHAEERNIQIAKVNPKFPDGGSGIDTADARAYLRGLDPAKRKVYEALAKRADAISKETRELLVRSGLETRETIDSWEKAYKSYVPLFREDADFVSPGGMGSGSGFSVRGPASKRATGSSREVVDIMANLAMQRERAIVRAEKTRVATSLYGLAVQNPNTQFWLPVDPKAIKDVTGTMAELVNMGINPLDVQKIIQEPKETYIDPRTGLATQRVNPALRNADNVLAVRINGEDKYLFFNNRDERAQRMVTALKNLDPNQLGQIMSMSAAVSRYFAAINTQYNPVFGAINLLRDTQGALFNLSTTAISDRKAEVSAGILPAIAGIYADLRSRRAGKGASQGVWAGLWEEFQNEGGQTGFRDMFKTGQERAKSLQAEINQINEGTLKQAGRGIFNWLSDYNETLENAVRLSAYKAAKDKGLSNQQAASIAKNLTVNFNRKGEIGVQAGALYAFFNASVQGTARLYETLTGPAGKKIMAGGLLLGVVQALALAAAGFKDDEPPDFIKERNLVIPTGDGKYVTIPMPLGLNVIPNTSRVLTEWALSGWKKPTKRVAQITGAFLEMFNPIGNAGWSVQTIAPTFADPLVALGENRDWTGKPIAKEDRSGTDPTPGYTRAKDTASWVSKGLSYYLNLATGGTKYTQGLISPTPDQIDYLIGQATGGVGREILKLSQFAESKVTGEELPSNKVPILGRFYGDTKEQSAVATRFYENITEINEHKNEIKGRIKNREGGIAEYRRENPEAALVPYANAVEREVAELRRRKREMLAKDASPESIKIIEERIRRRMQQLNDRVERTQATAQ